MWVNCYGVIAPVQAWSFTNALFDTRQARRLFGLIGAGASLGAIAAGLMALFLVGPVGGTVNMMLVLAALILLSAVIVSVASLKTRRPISGVRPRAVTHPFSDSMRQIAGSPYLRLIAALVFIVAIATQWTAFQLSLVADQQFAGKTDAITRFFGTFSLVIGIIAFLLQVLLTGPALQRFGLAVTIMALPLLLGVGSALILIAPAFWSVLLTSGFDQGLRFSVDKATYELLYLPLPQGTRVPLKNTIDIAFNRFADGVGAALLFVATKGFGPRAARNGGHQHRRDWRVGRRGLAASLGVRPDDPRQHPSVSPRHGVATSAGSIGARGAERQARVGDADEVCAALGSRGVAPAHQVVPGGPRPAGAHGRRRAAAGACGPARRRAIAPSSRARPKCCAIRTSACAPRRCCTCRARAASIRCS